MAHFVIEKLTRSGMYQVRNTLTGHVLAQQTTLEKAKAQVRLMGKLKRTLNKIGYH